MKHRCLAGVLAGIMLISTGIVTGCTVKEVVEESKIAKVEPMEKEESYAISFDIIGGKDVMPIGGYSGPALYNYCWDGNEMPDSFSDEMMELIKGAGINMITHSGILTHKTMDVVYQLLAQAEKHNLGVLSIDAASIRGGEDALTPTQIGERLAKQFQYDSFCGLYLVDEVSAPYFYGEFENKYISKFKERAKIFNRDLRVYTYATLFPMGSVKDMDIFEQYVDEFIETMEPAYLEWDEYVFTKVYGGDVSSYIVSMSILSKKSKEHKIPFYPTIQAGDQWGLGATDSETPYWPNEAQFYWNVNTALAYGAQQLHYYTLNGYPMDLVDAEGGLDPYRASIIGAMGNKTKWYYYAQNINKHVAAIDHVLMNSVNKGVIIKGKQIKKDFKSAYEVLEGEKFQELQSVKGDEVMIGCFNYNGKTALYVVNYDMEYAQKITLNLNTKHNITVTQEAETSYVRTNALTLDMAAGEGVLLVIE